MCVDYMPGSPGGRIEESDETNNCTAYVRTLTVIPRLTELRVDDNAPGDPGPNNPNLSDPAEDGSAEHPFDTIQEAIDTAIDFDTIIVAEGTYTENINFSGKSIFLTSTGPTNSNIVKSTTIVCIHTCIIKIFSHIFFFF